MAPDTESERADTVSRPTTEEPEALAAAQTNQLWEASKPGSVLDFWWAPSGHHLDAAALCRSRIGRADVSNERDVEEWTAATRNIAEFQALKLTSDSYLLLPEFFSVFLFGC